MPPRVLPSHVVAFIDRTFPNARAQVEQPQGPAREWYVDATHSATLATLVDLADKIPSELLELDNEHHFELVTGLTSIRNSLGTWQSRGHVDALQRIPGFSDLNPVSLIRRALDLCPDQAPSPATVELAFIVDQEFRNDLRLDISAATRALSSGDWKTATVLSGSVVEALLLWRLRQQPQDTILAKDQILGTPALNDDPGNNLEDWTLHPLIEVAAHRGVINPNTAILARLAKNFRNLIHPGRAIRLGQKCDRGTALSTLAAVERVVQDLTPP